MIFAEIGLDTIAGGGVTAMLVAVLVHMLRRTKDTDERRDEVTQMVLSTASEREARAWAERDRALTERDRARAELDLARAELNRLRELLDRQGSAE